MKSISSHVLDGVRGSDAIGLRVSAYRLAATGEKSKIVEVQTDRSGRLTIEVEKKKEKIVTAISKFVKASHVLQASL